MNRMFTMAALVASFGVAGTAVAQFQDTDTPGGTASPFGPMLKSTVGWQVDTLFTVSETLQNTDGAYTGAGGDFTPVGILDGLGAYSLDGGNTVRVLANHELLSSRGYAYDVNVGTANQFSLPGARVSYFDIDVNTRKLVDAGQAFNKIYDRSGALVTSAAQLEYGGLQRLCSSVLIEAHQFGTGRGLNDRIYFAGEEQSSNFGAPGGTEWALDTATGDLWAVPAMGRGSWENVTEIDSGRNDRVAFLLGDDQESAPLYLYVGKKGLDKSGSASSTFLARNGLDNGQLYVWKADSGATTPTGFKGTGNSESGKWVPVQNTGVAGTGLVAGNDFFNGYASDAELNAQNDALGGFSFSRPEDLAVDPNNGSRAVMASTGRDTWDGGSDRWGITYLINNDLNYDANGDLDILSSGTTLEIIYDGDDAGNGQFAGPDFGLRSPDNLDWADDGLIYLQEDRAIPGANSGGDWAATSGNEAAIWQLDPATGLLTRVAEIDRTQVHPGDLVDKDPTDIGDWESSGILDVSTLFGEAPGTLFLADIQAHSLEGDQAGKLSKLENFINADGDEHTSLEEGGQLVFITVPEPSSLALLGLGGLLIARRRRG